MRADENTSARVEGKRRLIDWLERQPIGHVVPIGQWYRIAEQLGIGRCDTQRISDARKEGYDFTYDRKDKVYRWMGKPEPGQLSLLEVNG